jgi:hypothetical protein
MRSLGWGGGGLRNTLSGHAAIAVNGHEHNMQRLRPINGITELISGAGGKSLYELNENDLASRSPATRPTAPSASNSSPARPATPSSPSAAEYLTQAPSNAARTLPKPD